MSSPVYKEFINGITAKRYRLGNRSIKQGINSCLYKRKVVEWINVT